MEPDRVLPADPPGPALGRAVEHLVLALPPKERACVLLKDVFDYSLEEIAELVDSTVGGVKAALHRGRSKLAALPERGAPRRAKEARNPEAAQLLHLYVERFNRRDWDGLRELIADDARLRVADRFTGPLAEAPYFANYQRWPVPWRLAVGEVDGEPVVLVAMDRDGEGWKPEAVVHLEVTDHRVTGIRDYIHSPWLLAAARSVVADPLFPTDSRRVSRLGREPYYSENGNSNRKGKIMNVQTAPQHDVVSPEKWITARKELLRKEKELTRLRDELSRQRRELPWEKVEKNYVFEGPDGQEALADLFGGRSQLMVYHFMFGPEWPEGCPSCSMVADHFGGSLVHLAAAGRDAGRGFTGAPGPDRGVPEAHGVGIQVGLVARERLQPRLSRLLHAGRDGPGQGALQLRPQRVSERGGARPQRLLSRTGTARSSTPTPRTGGASRSCWGSTASSISRRRGATRRACPSRWPGSAIMTGTPAVEAAPCCSGEARP